MTMAATRAGAPPVSVLRLLFGIFTNPRAVFQAHLTSIPAPLCLLISGLAFGLFYLQTGRDISHAGRVGMVHAAALGALGLVVGTAGVGLLASIAWVLTRPFRGGLPLGWAVRAFGLAYSPALIYGALGLGANVLLHWNTSLAFGATGVLWALGPMFVAIREMTGQRAGASAVVATICGALMLVGWALIVK
jgi:hypothetical protein